MPVITEDILNRIPASLRKNDNWYHLILNNSLDPIFIVDMDSQIIAANDKAAFLLEYSEDELIEMGFDDLYGDVKKISFSLLISILEENGSYRFKDSILNKDGNLIPVESDYFLSQSLDQKVILVIIRDLREQKQLEDDLTASCAKLKKRLYERTCKLAKLNREYLVEVEKQKDILNELKIAKILTKQLSESIIAYDMDGNIHRWLGKSEKIFGYSAGDIEGKKVSLLFDPCVIDHIFPDINKSFALSGEFIGKIPCLKKDGSSIIVEASIRPVLNETGILFLNIAVIRDITEILKLESERTESEVRYNKLVNSQQDCIIRIDTEGKIIFANDNFCKKFMKKRTDLINKEIIFIFDEFRKSNNNSNIQSLDEKNKGLLTVPLILEQFANTTEGWRWIAWINSPIRDKDGKIIEFQCVGHDITMLKKTEEKMQSYQKKLQSLAFEMSVIEERQRRYIAQVLHDNIGQSLALCNLQLGLLSSSRCSRESRSKIEQIQETMKSVIKETRSLTSDLNPPALYEIGLGKAIKRLTEKFFDNHDLRIQYYEHGKPFQLSSDILGLLFQITRELFVNIVKHAKAQNVKVHLRYSESQIQLEVKDDGIGFDKNHLLSNVDKSNCFGLFSVSERIQYLGGFVKINSKPGKGTEIILSVPYKLNISHSNSAIQGEI